MAAIRFFTIMDLNCGAMENPSDSLHIQKIGPHVLLLEWLRSHVCMYVCMFSFLLMSMYILYVCMHVCMYVCMYVYLNVMAGQNTYV